VAGEWVQGLSAGEGAEDMKKIAFAPDHTWIHALHPFTKFTILIGLSVLVFFIRSAQGMVLVFAFILSCFFIASRNPFVYFGMRTTVVTALMIGIIQCIFTRQGTEVFNLLRFTITDYGIQRAIVISVRFLVIVLGSYLFILTTSPSDFAFAIMQMGVPYRYAFLIVTSMRLVPILSIDGERIMDAQRLRGARYDVRTPRLALLHMNAFLGAVLYSLVERVNTLSISMEGRSFGRYHTRTYQQSIRFAVRDGVAFGCTLLLISIIFYIDKKWKILL